MLGSRKGVVIRSRTCRIVLSMSPSPTPYIVLSAQVEPEIAEQYETRSQIPLSLAAEMEARVDTMAVRWKSA